MTTTRRVIIADDEPLAREWMRMLLARHPEYQVVTECEDGGQAVEAIVREQPDVVFLDVRMPELDGIGVAQALEARIGDGQRTPIVVFVTAFEEHALAAFGVQALDYLLKPADAERLARTLARVEERLVAASAGIDPAVRALLASLEGAPAFPERFLVRDSRGGLYFVRSTDIDWVDAQANYVRLHAGGRAHLVRDTMKAFEQKLDPQRFIRVHRSAIVNIDRVQRLEPWAHGEYTLTLADGAKLRSSRAYSTRLQQLLR